MNDLKAATATNRTFMDMDYGYDPVGNILALANVAPMPPSPSISGGQTSYTFGYDDLHQLKTGAGTYTTLPNKTEKFTLSLAYDEIHNITSKDQLAGSLKNNGTIQPDKKITTEFPLCAARNRSATGPTPTAHRSRMPPPTSAIARSCTTSTATRPAGTPTAPARSAASSGTKTL